GVSERADDRHRFFEREPARRDPVAERAAAEEGHGVERPALRAAALEERDEALGLAQEREDALLAREADLVRLVERARGEELHGDDPARGRAPAMHDSRAA